jgi:pyruvate/2-oxoglutarate dehydrogenase complex dihydrolipoamide dehydrogenase (E3) component
MTDVDVVVVGLGPGGEATANKLATAGLDVVAVDKGLVGGECPYFGCIPSKMMIRAAHSLAESRRVAALAGESTTTAAWTPVADRIRDEATDDWDDTAAVKRLEDNGARVARGRGRLTGERTVEVDGTTFTARRGVVINTGTDPMVPPIEGLADTPYWTNRDIVRMTELPASLVIIGGGAIGCEFAQALTRFGVRVTLVEGTDRIMLNEEPETSELVTSVFTREGIRVMTGNQVDSVANAVGQFTLSVGGEKLTADKVLVSAGRTPNIRDIGLDVVGVKPDARSIDTDKHMHVVADGTVEWLYAAGDITGKGAFTHMSMYQSGIVVDTILGHDGPAADYRAVPRVTFTDPEVGSVGMTEGQARDAGLDVSTGKVELGDSTRGWIHHVGNEGFVKLVAADGKLVGATSVGPTGGEVLSMLTAAIHGRIPVSDLKSMIYAYPTFHGIVRQVLDDLG